MAPTHLPNKNGFSTVSVMTAAGILTMLGLVLVTAMRGIFDEGQRTRLVSRQLAIESTLLSGLRSSASYTPEQIESLKNKIAPDGMTFNDQNGLNVGVVGQIIYLRLDGTNCTAGEFGTNQCLLSSEVKIKCESLMVTGPASITSNSDRCRAAYRIKGKLNNEVPVANLGVKKEGEFIDADYDVIIPYDIYSGKEIAVSCLPDTQLAVTGFVRDTGGLKCIEKPKNRCPDRTIGKEIKYDINNKSLELVCVPVDTLTCPANYLVYTFDPSTLAQDGGTHWGKCVFIGVDTTGPWPNGNPTPAAAAVSGRFCPNHYEAVIDRCDIVNIDAKTVTCAKCKCNCRQQGSPPVEVCDTCGGETLPPVPGSCQTSVSGPYADASIDIPTQPKCECGPKRPTWNGEVQMAGHCQLSSPREVWAL